MSLNTFLRLLFEGVPMRGRTYSIKRAVFGVFLWNLFGNLLHDLHMWNHSVFNCKCFLWNLFGNLLRDLHMWNHSVFNCKCSKHSKNHKNGINMFSKYWIDKSAIMSIVNTYICTSWSHYVCTVDSAYNDNVWTYAWYSYIRSILLSGHAGICKKMSCE